MKKISFFLLLFLGSKVATAQCAMCRAVLETQEGQTAAEGINNGIVLFNGHSLYSCLCDRLRCL